MLTDQGKRPPQAIPSVDLMRSSTLPDRSSDVPPSAVPPAARGTSPRVHHLDALRGGALLLGVLLHALMPYMPGSLWLVSDTSDSWGAVAAVGVIHLFRMMLFMMLAGYLGHLVIHRRGAKAYLRDRLLRVGLPIVTLGPVLFAIMIAAIVANTMVGAMPMPEQGPEQAAAGSFGPLAVPTMHLWFLLLLLEIVVVVVVARAILRRVLGADRSARLAGRIGDVLASPWGLPLIAAPYALGLLAQPGNVTGLTEPYTLQPVAGASIGYGAAFLTGWFLRARDGGMARVETRWAIHLGLAVVLSPLALTSPMFAPPLLGAAFTALAGWAWVLGLTGLCARLVRREIGWIRYLADASYWVYLMHFPLLLVVAVPLSLVELPIVVELALGLAVTLGLLLLSYDLCVRSTWIGAWLNGHRRPRALRPGNLRRRRTVTPAAGLSP